MVKLVPLCWLVMLSVVKRYRVQCSEVKYNVIVGAKDESKDLS